MVPLLEVHGQPPHEVARFIVALNAGRGTLNLRKIESGIVEFVLAEQRHIPMHEITHSRQSVKAHFQIIRTSA